MFQVALDTLKQYSCGAHGRNTQRKLFSEHGSYSDEILVHAEDMRHVYTVTGVLATSC
jgi:hypothetical protein